jgi:hypothetical protein
MVGPSPHLTEELAVTDTILALDLAKYKSMACLYHPATAEAAFRTLDTSRAELTRLIARARQAVVVIEACTLSGWIHDLCGELGVPCRVANTAAEAWFARPVSDRKPHRGVAHPLGTTGEMRAAPAWAAPTARLQRRPRWEARPRLRAS